MTVPCKLHSRMPTTTSSMKHGGRSPDFTDFWCNLVDVKTYRGALLFLSPSSLAGGMRFAAVGLDQ